MENGGGLLGSRRSFWCRRKGHAEVSRLVEGHRQQSAALVLAQRGAYLSSPCLLLAEVSYSAGA